MSYAALLAPPNVPRSTTEYPESSRRPSSPSTTPPAASDNTRPTWRDRRGDEPADILSILIPRRLAPALTANGPCAPHDASADRRGPTGKTAPHFLL